MSFSDISDMFGERSRGAVVALATVACAAFSGCATQDLVRSAKRVGAHEVTILKRGVARPVYDAKECLLHPYKCQTQEGAPVLPRPTR